MLLYPGTNSTQQNHTHAHADSARDSGADLSSCKMLRVLVVLLLLGHAVSGSTEDDAHDTDVLTAVIIGGGPLGLSVASALGSLFAQSTASTGMAPPPPVAVLEMGDTVGNFIQTWHDWTIPRNTAEELTVVAPDNNAIVVRPNECNTTAHDSDGNVYITCSSSQYVAYLRRLSEEGERFGHFRTYCRSRVVAITPATDMPSNPMSSSLPPLFDVIVQDGRLFRTRYVVIATGRYNTQRPLTSDGRVVPGAHLPHVLPSMNLRARDVKEFFTGPNSSAVVIGGGVSALEIVSGLSRQEGSDGNNIIHLCIRGRGFKRKWRHPGTTLLNRLQASIGTGHLLVHMNCTVKWVNATHVRLEERIQGGHSYDIRTDVVVNAIGYQTVPSFNLSASIVDDTILETWSTSSKHGLPGGFKLKRSINEIGNNTYIVFAGEPADQWGESSVRNIFAIMSDYQYDHGSAVPSDWVVACTHNCGKFPPRTWFSGCKGAGSIPPQHVLSVRKGARLAAVIAKRFCEEGDNEKKKTVIGVPQKDPILQDSPPMLYYSLDGGVVKRKLVHDATGVQTKLQRGQQIFHQPSAFHEFCDYRRIPEQKKVRIFDLRVPGLGCPVSYAPEGLVARCRKSLEFHSPSRGYNRLTGIQVPPFRKIEFEIKAGAKIFRTNHERSTKKYQQRVQKKNQCDQPKGMWGNPLNHDCIIKTIGIMAQYRPGDLVLDWGSGCGHQSTLMTQLFDVDVIGLDVTEAAVHWAQEHAIGTFYYSNGLDLSWAPKDTFDHFFAFASILYVPGALMCAFGREVVRILRSGGTAFFGWLNNRNGKLGVFEKESNQTYYEELPKNTWSCLHDVAYVDVIDDVLLWRANAQEPSTERASAERVYHNFLTDKNSYSVFLRKK